MGVTQARLWISGLGCRWSNKRHDGKRAHTLSTVNEHAFDVRGRGRAGVEGGVVLVMEFSTPISVVQIDHDVRWIEQHDQVLREIGDRVELESASLSRTEPVSATAKDARTMA